MNILVLFSHKWKGGRAGGGEIHVIDLINELSRRGHKIVFATDEIHAEMRFGSPDGVLAHVELPFKSSSPLDKLNVYRELAELINRYKIDIIHAHHRTGGYYAEYLYRKKQVPYVVTAHDRWEGTPCKGLHRYVLRNLISVSEFIKRNLVRRFHIPAERVRTIYNGVDPARFGAVEAGAALRFREKYGAGRGEVVLSLIGRVRRVKGHYDLLRSLRLLPAALRYRCFIVGEGKDRKPLERLVHAYALEGKVVFCGYQPDIPLVMSASDIVLLPSHREPFGLTIIEAMLCRKPVIASNGGAVPEIITHNRDGILFPARDVSALAKSITHLIHNPELRCRLAEEGYQTVRKRFLLGKMIDETEEHYRTILYR
jgi:glycosyltransferase involved in cell wall biosynthesis